MDDYHDTGMDGCIDGYCYIIIPLTIRDAMLCVTPKRLLATQRYAP